MLPDWGGGVGSVQHWCHGLGLVKARAKAAGAAGGSGMAGWGTHTDLPVLLLLRQVGGS